MGPAVTGQIALGLLDLGSISQGFVSTGQGACARCCPAGTWDNLEQPGFAVNHHLLPFRRGFGALRAGCAQCFSGLQEMPLELVFTRFYFPCGVCWMPGHAHFQHTHCATCQMQAQLINCVSCCSCLLTGDV